MPSLWFILYNLFKREESTLETNILVWVDASEQNHPLASHTSCNSNFFLLNFPALSAAKTNKRAKQ